MREIESWLLTTVTLMNSDCSPYDSVAENLITIKNVLVMLGFWKVGGEVQLVSVRVKAESSNLAELKFENCLEPINYHMYNILLRRVLRFTTYLI